MADAVLNTDRELYLEPDETCAGDYYSPSIHVTKEGGIGINVGGYVIVKTLREWHALAPQEISNEYHENDGHRVYAPTDEGPVEDEIKSLPVEQMERIAELEASIKDAILLLCEMDSRPLAKSVLERALKKD